MDNEQFDSTTKSGNDSKSSDDCFDTTIGELQSTSECCTLAVRSKTVVMTVEEWQ